LFHNPHVSWRLYWHDALCAGSDKLYTDESRRLRPFTEDPHHHSTVPWESRRRIVRCRPLRTYRSLLGRIMHLARPSFRSVCLSVCLLHVTLCRRLSLSFYDYSRISITSRLTLTSIVPVRGPVICTARPFVRMFVIHLSVCLSSLTLYRRRSSSLNSSVPWESWRWIRRRRSVSTYHFIDPIICTVRLSVCLLRVTLYRKKTFIIIQQFVENLDDESSNWRQSIRVYQYHSIGPITCTARPSIRPSVRLSVC